MVDVTRRDRVLVQTASCLSIVGSLFIIFSYWKFKDARKFSRLLLVYLSMADLLSSAAFLFGTAITTSGDSPSSLCVLQGFMLQFSVLASYLWTACLAMHLYRIIWKQDLNSESYELRYHVLSWGVPFVTLLYMLAKMVLGYRSMGTSDRPWCWIDNDVKSGWSVSGSVEQFVLFYVPTGAAFLFNVYIYLFLARRVRMVLGDGMENKVKRRLLLYLLVFFVVVVWGYINRVYQAVSSRHHLNNILLSSEAFFTPLQGALNALVYGYSGLVRQRYREMLGLAGTAGKGSSFLLESGSDGSYEHDSLSQLTEAAGNPARIRAHERDRLASSRQTLAASGYGAT